MTAPESAAPSALRNGVRAAALLDASVPLAARLRPMWCATLGRPPSDGEIATVATLLPGATARELADEIWWSLVNSSEFRSNE